MKKQTKVLLGVLVAVVAVVVGVFAANSDLGKGLLMTKSPKIVKTCPVIVDAGNFMANYKSIPGSACDYYFTLDNGSVWGNVTCSGNEISETPDLAGLTCTQGSMKVSVMRTEDQDSTIAAYFKDTINGKASTLFVGGEGEWSILKTP